MRTLPLITVLALTPLGCSSSGTTPVTVTDAGARPDTGGSTDGGSGGGTDGGSSGDRDGGTDGGARDVGTDAATMVRCGTARPDISGISGAEGLMIGADGTIYYAQQGGAGGSPGVGRMRPGMAQEDTWLSLPAAANTVWGLTLDNVGHKLYVGSPITRTIYVADFTQDAPTATPFVTNAGQPNGLTTGPDGALWYTDFGGNAVFRVDATGIRTRVTTSMIPQANGIAFGPDGKLYVDAYGSGTVVRLTLTANIETARAIAVRGVGAADGLAFDATGRIYVTDNAIGTLTRFDADGTNPMMLLTGMMAPANVEFGAGALQCTDLYIATGGVLMRYEMGTTPGLDVIWHH